MTASDIHSRFVRYYETVAELHQMEYELFRVCPYITIHDDAAFIEELKAELQPLVPDDKVSIVIDHNYSE